jgi:tetratricopeptide (TPR) repeat protein
LAWQLSDVVWPLQLYRKSGDRRDFDERGLAAARMWGEPFAEARMLRRLGRTSSTLGEHDEAERLLTAAMARFRQAGAVDESIESEGLLALAYRDAGRLEAASDLLRRVLAEFRARGRDRDIGLTLINLGDLSSRLGRQGEAIEFLREAGGLLERSVAADPYNPVRVRAGLARAYLAAGDLPAADRAAAEALDGMRRLGTAVGEAEALELAGVIATRRGDVTLGRSHLRRALSIFEAHGSPRAVALRERLTDRDDGAVPEAGGDASGFTENQD